MVGLLCFSPARGASLAERIADDNGPATVYAGKAALKLAKALPTPIEGTIAGGLQRVRDHRTELYVDVESASSALQRLRRRLLRLGFRDQGIARGNVNGIAIATDQLCRDGEPRIALVSRDPADLRIIILENERGCGIARPPNLRLPPMPQQVASRSIRTATEVWGYKSDWALKLGDRNLSANALLERLLHEFQSLGWLVLSRTGSNALATGALFIDANEVHWNLMVTILKPQMRRAGTAYFSLNTRDQAVRAGDNARPQPKPSPSSSP